MKVTIAKTTLLKKHLMQMELTTDRHRIQAALDSNSVCGYVTNLHKTKKLALIQFAGEYYLVRMLEWKEGKDKDNPMAWSNLPGGQAVKKFNDPFACKQFIKTMNNLNRCAGSTHIYY